ncbi:MAG: 3-oxoacyl-ACP reductase FabG [Deltaproteobacteria bacterium]|nr:3-oxoacyl-ACP reductase FabG [Deltaproteobacteria bacterium]
MHLDLTDKIALVTGGSRGIGRECALRLSRSGARVIINYHKSHEQAEEVLAKIAHHGSEADLFQADISQPDGVEMLFSFVRERFENLDILVNNAGIIKDNLLLSMKISDWDRVHDVNLRGAFLCTKWAAEMMMLNHRGKIINIASVAALRGGTGQANYASAKGGLVSFTRACAVELSGKGIQVNAVLPGFIVTDMSKRVRKRGGDLILKQIPAGRFGMPIEVANIVAFLASDQSDYISGQAISVDGGLSIS